MAYFLDSRNDWINSWATRHVEERPGEPFPKEAVELWAKLDAWVLNYSYWAVKTWRATLDPVELAENVRDRILANSATYRGEGTCTAWMHILGFNTMRSMLKAKRHANTSYIEDELKGRGEDILRDNRARTVELFGGDPKDILNEMLARLPNQRAAQILRLRRIEGWKDTEIAAKLNMTPGAVHQIIMRAMRQLRSFADGEGTPRKKVDQRVRVKRAAS